MKATHLLALWAALAGGLAVAAETDKKSPTIRILPRGSIAVTSTDLVSTSALGTAVGQYANQYKKRFGDPPRVGLRIELNAPVKFENLRLIASLGERVGFPYYEVVSGPFHVRLDREIGDDGEATLVSKFVGEKVKKGRQFAFGGYWFESADQIREGMETIWQAAAADRPFVKNPFTGLAKHRSGDAFFSDGPNPFDRPAKDNPFSGGGASSDPFADPDDAPADPFGGGSEPAPDPFGGGAPEPRGDPFGGDDEPSDVDPFAEPDDAARNPFRDSEPAPMPKNLTGTSEAAPASSLQWLSAHQKKDGSWSFDHREGGPSQADPGTLKSTPIAATALALLPFLGAGQTHQEGRYQETVRRGLGYLAQGGKPGIVGTDYAETGGRLYSHGLVTLALCEAYAMTADNELKKPAQKAVDFIVYAQDPVGGGWRYMPRQVGDVSVTALQLLALRSAQMAGLEVPRKTLDRANGFLDRVQSDGGAKYGYTAPGDRPSTTAMGLVSRMMLGADREQESFKRGAKFIADTGPSQHNMYFNFYATLLIRQHYDHADEWKNWNVEIRDYLIETQSKAGAEAGSWFFKGEDHGAARGGRVYCTAMATLILEVHYRHLPIFRKAAIGDE
jgi:hypothetical protein